MPVTTETKVGICPVCEVNVYDRGTLNKPFTHLGRTKQGYPADVSLPCGIDRTPENSEDLKSYKEYRDLTQVQRTRCPFETKEQQAAIDEAKKHGIISGANMWDEIGAD